MHPAKELLEEHSNRLSGKKILLGITGSIAAVECVKLVHELIRHGADVFPVLTHAACRIIDPEALRFASGNAPITQLTGNVEHVSLCGQVQDRADLLLIAPCTANTISKIACGIDDTTVTTFATTAIGSNIPIMIVPAMHSSMYDHAIIQQNVAKLKDKKHGFNIEFIEPRREENKYKMPSIDEIVAKVIRQLWKSDLKGKRILVIGGATAEPIDDMRILTNKSTGTTGIALAKIAYMRGADTRLWLGRVTVEPPRFLTYESFQTANELKKKSKVISKTGKNAFDIIIVCAAISDYSPKKTHKGKIPSGMKEITLELKPTQKIIKNIRDRAPKSYLIGFKAEPMSQRAKLIEKAKNRLSSWKLNMIIANYLADVTMDSNRIFIIHSNNDFKEFTGNKEYLAERIFDEVLNNK